jgi:anti-sigma regulatory factor (Ser/Thr protein kinase)
MKRIVLPTLFMLTCTIASAEGETLPVQRKRGDALVMHLRAQAPAEALTNTGILRIRDANGRRRQWPVTIATWPEDGGWKVRYEARSETNGPVEALTVTFATNRPPTYGTLPSIGAAPTSVRPFAGTDFWWCDLGLEFLHWPDQRVVKQVLLNLLSNAVKFSNIGGRIEVRAVQGDGTMVLSVEDNGIGIPPEFLSKIAQPFEQASNDPARTHGGSGLGLALVKSLVALHGGEFGVESTLGKGTRVTVKLPLVCKAPGKAA